MKRRGFPLYFNHVPKCGGTTLNEVLSRGLHRDQVGVEPFVPVDDIYTMRAERFDRLALIGSHIPHWVAARRFAGWTRLTMLREPWQRFQALCRHLLRIRASAPQALYPQQSEFLALIDEDDYEQALQHSQSWYPWISGIARYFLPDPPGETWPADADTQAANVLAAYDFVLLTDRLHDDAVLIDRCFNGQSFGAPARLNTSVQFNDRGDGPFPDGFRDLHAGLYPDEQRLHALARALHSRTIARLHDALDAPAHRAYAHSTAPLRYVHDWAAPTRCGGFSDRLIAGSQGYAGVVARRVEAPVAQLDFEVRGRGAARVEIVAWIAPVESRGRVSLSLNGAPLDFFDPQREVVDRSQVWSAVDVDAHTIGDGRCRLEIDRRDAPDLAEFWVLDLAVR